MQKTLQSFIIFGLMAGVAGCGTTQDAANSTGTDKTETPSMEIGNDIEYGEMDYELIADASNKLGMKMLKDLSSVEDENIFVSPTSLYMALAMVYNGAAGVTKDEIADVLEAEGLSPEEMNKANASLISMLSSDSEDIELNIANSIWVKDNYEFLGDFTKSSQD
ncbi:hypothetical protein EEX84_02365 [Planococcus salinus]|uniref:Serpin domain-containing protein n=1 Tax=Planococcus salinus TaxID=1848460 RepID=A0A3M8PDG7_9BACL|nr:hypothetical protein EEX84_02365 [Planococcus salinus]